MWRFAETACVCVRANLRVACPHKPALGNGSNANGGAPSTADGWFIAFGGTLEDITRETRGLLQIGKEGDNAFDRTTGEGYVAPVDGDYADAIRKKIPMILFTCETSGARGPRRSRPPRAPSPPARPP